MIKKLNPILFSKALFFIIAFILFSCKSSLKEIKTNDEYNNTEKNESVKEDKKSKFFYKFLIINKLSPEKISEDDNLLLKQLINLNTTILLYNIEDTLLSLSLRDKIHIISPFGNIIFSAEHLNSQITESIIKKIYITDSLYNAYNINIDVIKSHIPLLTSIETTNNYFEGGTFNNYIIPQKTIVKGTTSLIIHTIPVCPPCRKLRNKLLEESDFFKDINVYFFNHAFDDAGNQYSQKEMNNNPFFKTYVAEGLKVFPTVWIIDKDGNIIKTYDAIDIDDYGVSLFEYTKKILSNYCL